MELFLGVDKGVLLVGVVPRWDVHVSECVGEVA